MATRAFTVCEKAFEYDDNYYNPSEGGTPTTVFFKREQADRHAQQKNIEQFRRLCNDGELQEYSGEVRYDKENIRESFQKCFPDSDFKDWCDNGWRARLDVDDVPEADLAEFMNACGLGDFYYVVEVEVQGHVMA